MPPRRPARSVSRRSTPLSPPRPAPPSTRLDASNLHKRATRSSSREPTAAQYQRLTTEQSLRELVEHVERHDDDGLAERDSFSREPTTQASDSESMLDDLDPTLIVENITLLHDDSVDLLDRFDGLDDIQLRALLGRLTEPSSSQRKSFRIRQRRFLTSLEPYGESKYIRPELVLASLTARNPDGDPEGPWRPDAVFYLANLALQMIAALSENPEHRLDYLQHMFNSFHPTFADLELFAVGDHLLDQTVHMQLDVLTQFYISRAEADKARPNFDPDALLEQVFLEDEVVRVFPGALARDKTTERMAVIKTHLRTDPEHPVDVDSLKEQFPWSDFLVGLTKWTMARKRELDELISSIGGIDTISTLLSARFSDDSVRSTNEAGNEAQSATNDSRERQTPVSPPNHDSATQRSQSGPPTGNKLTSRYARYRAIRAIHAAETSGADTSLAMAAEVESVRQIPQSPTPAQDDGDDDDVPADDDEASAHAPSSSVALSDAFDEIDKFVMETINRQQEQSQKENKGVTAKKRSLLDRQEDAERVEFSEAPEVDLPVRKPDKRRRAETESSEDEDEDEDEYETDNRPAKKPRLGGAQGRPPFAALGNRERGHRRTTLKDADQIGGDDGDEGDAERQATSAIQRSPPLPRPTTGLPRSGQPHAATGHRETGSRRPARKDAREVVVIVDDDEDGDTEPQTTSATRRTQPHPGSTPGSQPFHTAERDRDRHHLPASTAPQPHTARTSTYERRASRPPLESFLQPSRALPSSAPNPDRGLAVPPSSSAPNPQRHGGAPARRNNPWDLEPPRSQFAEVHREVNREAKLASLLHRELHQSNQVQVRKAYSDAETERLVEMVALYGTKWARILNEDQHHPQGPLLQNRNQVQLKDKARNIKLEFLKYVDLPLLLPPCLLLIDLLLACRARRPLPEGFELVSIGTRQIAILRQLGIDYVEGRFQGTVYEPTFDDD